MATRAPLERWNTGGDMSIVRKEARERVKLRNELNDHALVLRSAAALIADVLDRADLALSRAPLRSEATP